jgi:hypothetical protein
MNRRLATAGCLAALLLCGQAAVWGQDPKEAQGKDSKAAQERLAKHLGDLAKGGQIVSIGSEPLAKTFPDYQFFALRFRIYPVARVLPEGMKPSNVFAVPKDGKPEHLKDEKTLEAFFGKHGPAARGKTEAATLVRSWLSLSQEFVQDGFYKFDLRQPPEIKEEGGKVQSVSGRAMVVTGGNGEINATLKFGADGKVEKVAETRKIREGPRPICQATKLLDSDPIVRRMAERDLLYMGVAARDYLMEQRATAGPELRRAIDRLWQRIEQEGW